MNSNKRIRPLLPKLTTTLSPRKQSILPRTLSHKKSRRTKRTEESTRSMRTRLPSLTTWSDLLMMNMKPRRKTMTSLSLREISWVHSLSVVMMNWLCSMRRSKFYRVLSQRVKCSTLNVSKILSYSSLRSVILSVNYVLSRHRLIESVTCVMRSITYNNSYWLNVFK